MFQELMEQLVQYFSKEPYKKDFTRAKDTYVKTFGSVVEEHPYFDSWISGFFEWYLIDYKMLNLGVPPIFIYQRVFANKLESVEKGFLSELELAELQFMQVHSVAGQKIKAENMFTKAPIEFYSHENTALLSKSDYLITRIMKTQDRLQSFGVTWHFTIELSSILAKRFPKIKTALDQEYLLYELIKKKTQSEVYSHVPLDQIFGWKTESKNISDGEIRNDA